MNRPMIDDIARAILYEGYNLYPYRPSVKNRCRWTFGGLVPRSYSEAMDGAEAWNMQVQCLLQTPTTGHGTLEVQLRYLHLVQRTIGVLSTPCDSLPAEGDPDYCAVDSFVLGGVLHQGWQEAVERELTIGPLEIASLSEGPHRQCFTVPASHWCEPLRGCDGRIETVAVRDQGALEGEVEITAEVAAEVLRDPVYRCTVRVFNRTPLPDAALRSRDEALMQSLVATHAVLAVQGGKFYSLTDPLESLREVTTACRNIGVWPVLVGRPGDDDTMLASPIILYDYPRIAPESPGDLFDGTEIDEILTLRIMTLTEEEKAMAAATDDRTRKMLMRTETLAREQLAGLHGAVRTPSRTEATAQGIDHLVRPGEVADDPFSQPATVESIMVDETRLRPGDRVRLRPGLGGDIFDLVLSGKTATIESIEQDFEDRYHVAVTLDDDPGKDLGMARQPGHRFFFKPEEIAPLTEEES